MPNTGADATPLIDVAAAVMRDASGRVLIAQRPPGSIAEGQWEFPGGKIETGEDAPAALARELQEELGISAGPMRRFHRLRHDYGDRIVLLNILQLEHWQGEPRGLENQQLAWVYPEELHDWDLLAADGPIVTALLLPDRLAVSGTFSDVADLRRRVGLLIDRGIELLRLRLPEHSDDEYAELASVVIEVCSGTSCGVVLDRDPTQAVQLGASGWHATADRLRGMSEAPTLQGLRFSASVHGAQEARYAEKLGVDYCVLGPVKPTLTHPHADPLGWAGFSSVAAARNLPMYAIGGLAEADLADAWESGARGIAAIRSFWPD